MNRRALTAAAGNPDNAVVVHGAPQTADDLGLAQAAARGEEPALRELLSRVTPKVRGVAWHMTYDRHDSQDLCQEALIKVTSPQALRQYRGDGPLAAFAMSVAVRTMISVQRTKRARSSRDVDPLDSLTEGHPATMSTDDPFAGSVGFELRRAMERLPERARAVTLMIAVGDFTHQEVADELGLPVGTVKSTYHRARTELRRELAAVPLEHMEVGEA